MSDLRDTNLISGKEALIALANGEEVADVTHWQPLPKTPVE